MKSDSVFIGIIALGVLGIVIALLNLSGDSQPEVMVGLMISSSIVFAAGVLASVIAKQK